MTKKHTIILLIAFVCLLLMPCIGARPHLHLTNTTKTRVQSIEKQLLPSDQPVFSPSLKNNDDDFYFVHITDPHITDPGKASFGNLRNVLNTIREFHPQPAFILITGDLVHYGSKTYDQWPGDDAKSFWKTFTGLFHKKHGTLYLDSNYKIPVYPCPGNHDYVAFLYKGAAPIGVHFSLDNYYTYVRKKNGKWGANYYVESHGSLLIFLDSGHDIISWEKIVEVILNGRDALVAAESNGLSDTAIDFLRQTLKNHANVDRKIVCMHHPVYYEDNECYISKNKQAFVDLIRSYDVDLVLSGHTHQSYDGKHHGCMFVTTRGSQQDNMAFRVVRVEDGEIQVQTGGYQPHIEIDITRPSGGMYLFDRQILPIGDNVVIGPVTINIRCSRYLDKIDRVEFYVNRQKEHTVESLDASSCSWVYDAFGMGSQRTLKVVAYDEVLGGGYLRAEDTATLIDYL